MKGPGPDPQRRRAPKDSMGTTSCFRTSHVDAPEAPGLDNFVWSPQPEPSAPVRTPREHFTEDVPVASEIVLARTSEGAGHLELLSCVVVLRFGAPHRSKLVGVTRALPHAVQRNAGQLHEVLDFSVFRDADGAKEFRLQDCTLRRLASGASCSTMSLEK